MADLDAREAKNGDFIVPEIPVATWDAKVGAHDGSDTLAPLIFDCWYVIALAKDVDRTLGSIKVLGEPLVYYRTEDGRPIVLDDRCAHRRFPLSKGRLSGDAIQCGYHGFTYASSGQCIWAPGVPVNEDGGTKLPFGVRSYPCAEQGPWLWVWMGKPERADPKDIPLPDTGTDLDAAAYGYKLNPSNYMMVIENLLDLSHAHFLHDVVDLTYVATLPSDAPAPPNGVAWKKVVEPIEAGQLASFCGEDTKRLVRMDESNTQYGPSLTVGVQRREALPGDPEPVRPGIFYIVHALTPMDYRNTHQFFMLTASEPFALPTSELQHIAEDIVFEQDVVAVRDMQINTDEDVRPGRVEFNMAYDRFGLKMRRILKEMKERELTR